MNTNKTLISIIIPTYNAEKYIKKTIESVVNQSYENWELILIDDCSTDSTIHIINTYLNDNRISLIENNENSGGPAVPRNIGIERSSGDFIAFLDSDDIWLPDKLEKQLNFLDNNTIVSTRAYKIDSNDIQIGVMKKSHFVNLLIRCFGKVNIMLYKNFININTAIIPANPSVRFRTDKFFHGIEDWLFWFDLLDQGYNSVIIEEKLIKYRVHEESISSRHDDKSFRKYLIGITLLFYEKKIGILNLVFSIIIGLVRVILRNIRII